MEKIELGHTGELISCMGLGTMFFGSKTDEKVSCELLDQYLEFGGSFLDSANKYASWVPGFQGGESEKLIGKWMKQRGNRQKMFISSKVGFPYGNIPRSLKKDLIISECERSLKRLEVETIDLYFAHAHDPATPLEESMEAFFVLRRAGKIRFAGASNFYAWQLSEANVAASLKGWEGFACIQQRHTYLKPVPGADFGTQLLLTPEIHDFCMKENLGIMAYSPLLGGVYSRDDRPVPVQYQSPVNEYRMKVLKEVAHESNVSPNAIVLAWMMQSSPGVIPVVAGSSVEQLKENLQALHVRLSAQQMVRLNQDFSRVGDVSKDE
ncbi:MAG: aldo/keto reductase [Prolixibacteraceae bacterium]